MPRSNKPHCANDMLKCIFLNKNEWISLKISPQFIPIRNNNIPALV